MAPSVANPRDRRPHGLERRADISFESAGGLATLSDWLFLAVTGFIVWHAVRFRDESGSPDMVRLLFGCIAAMFFFKVLFEDVLRVARF